MRIKVRPKRFPTLRFFVSAGFLAACLKRESPGLAKAVSSLKKNKKKYKKILGKQPLIEVISHDGVIVEIRL